MGGDNGDLVADAAQTLIACMAASGLLITQPDATGPGFISGGATDSRPPWNAEAAWATLVPWQGVRDLEAMARRRAGLDPVDRGGSPGNTAAALDALTRITRDLPAEEVAWFARQLDRWAAMTFALPAVDKLPQWLEIPVPGGAPDCPWCTTGSLRWHEGYGVVACLYGRCPSLAGGQRQWARVGYETSGAMRWTWGDGTVQP